MDIMTLGAAMSQKLQEKQFDKNIVPLTSIKNLMVGKNLIDESSIIPGDVAMSTGVVDGGLPGHISDYIEIEPDTYYTRSQIGTFAFYNSDKVFVPCPPGYDSASLVLRSPNNARYIRVRVNPQKNNQLEEGIGETEYEPFGYRVEGLLYQNDLEKLERKINRWRPYKFPNPAKVEPEIYAPGGTVITYGDVDGQGLIWGVRWDNVLYKILQNGDSQSVLDLKPFLQEGETCSQYGLRVSETGRIIVGTNKGRVLVSDEEVTIFSEAFQFKGGYTQNTWGYDRQGQYILMASYVIAKNAENPAREVYLSKDHGATWELIFDKPIADMINPADYHLHDVAFDPYSGAIIVVQGDTVNNQIYYSYDFGKTWREVNPNGISKIHPTSILCFPEGVAFGSDDRPEGIYWWERPSDLVEPPIYNDDIKGVKLFNIGEPTLGNIAVKGDTLITENGSYGVIGFVNHMTSTPGNPRLFATGDGGRSWHEIFKEHDPTVKGFFSIHLREENGKVVIYANYSAGGTPKIFKAEMPGFVAV